MERNLTSYYQTVLERTRRHFPRSSPDDVVQETYHEALRYYGCARRPVVQPFGLLWTIAKRKALRPARGARIQTTALDPSARGPPGSTPAPWQLLAEREDHERLHALISGMDRLYAQAVVGHYFDGKSCAQLADEFGVTANAIKVRLSRGRAILKRALSRSYQA